MPQPISTLTAAGTTGPISQRLDGRIAVPVEPKNASAPVGFANLMQRHRLGTPVGEQTGGNHRGVNGGAFFFVGLPGSGLEVDLLLIAYRPDTPDLIVTAEATNIRAGRDIAARAFAIASR